MASYAQVAHDKRNAVIKEMRSLLDVAAGENRELTPEETEQTDRMEADIQRLQRETERELRAIELAKNAEEFRYETERVETARTDEAPKLREMDLLRKGWDAVKAGNAFAYDFGTDGGPAYTQTRALQSAGGSAVPTEFSSQVVVFMRTATPLLRPDVVTLIETSDGHPIQIPRLTADPNHGGTVTAEAGGINELDSTISSITLGSFKYGITNLYSRELLDDNYIGLESLIARSAARELRIDINTHLTTGTGTLQPKGIVDAATAGFTATGTASGSSTDTFFSPADLLDLYYSLPDEYRAAGNISWMASNTGVAKMRKFRDSNKGFIWDTSLVAGQPDRFNGWPVYENNAMAAVASATKSVIVGDLSAFYVRTTPLRVEISRDYKFNTDQVALRSIYRVDSNLPDVAAVRYLLSANT